MFFNKRKEKKAMKALKGKGFIDSDTAGYISDKLVAFMPSLKDMLDKYNVRPKDIIRFQPVADMCRKEREKKGFDFKRIAIDIGVQKYRLKDIENSMVSNIVVDILEKYIDYIGVRKWFDSWKKHNPDVYERLLKNKV